MATNGRHLGDHAIVIGGSLAGMAQAAILRGFFKTVTIVEADQIDVQACEPRPGVPHSRQLHGLLKRGLENFDRFLPGLKADLIAGGAVEGEFGRDVLWFMDGTWWSEVPAGVKAIGFTRPLFEAVIRRRLLAESRLVWRDASKVVGLVTDAAGKIARGVKIVSKNGESETLSGDLIVDCSGRHSKTLKWLGEIGIAEVPTEEVEINVCYTTQLIRFKKPNAWKTFYITVAPPKFKRQALILPAEDGNSVIGLAGFFNDSPPVDRAGIGKFLQTLSSPAMADIFSNIIPVSEPVSYRFKSNLRRYFAKTPNLPEGLVFAGDVVCSFNPIYGQGMTAASLGAETLQRCLAKCQKSRLGLQGLSREFHKAQDKALDQPWLQALINDMRFPEVKGPRNLTNRFMMSYMHSLLGAMHLQYVHERIIPIFNMMAHPLGVFSPRMLMTALFVKLGWIRPNSKIPARLRVDLAAAEPAGAGKPVSADANGF